MQRPQKRSVGRRVLYICSNLVVHLEGEPGFALIHVEGEVGGILCVVGVEGGIARTKVDQHCEVVRHAALHNQQCSNLFLFY